MTLGLVKMSATNEKECQMDFTKELRELQDEMAEIDLFTRPSRGSDFLEILVKQHRDIKLRIDGAANHGRAHLHLDYGGEYHATSYAIDNGERLAGTLDRKYDKKVREWITRNRSNLMKAWKAVHSGRGPNATTITALKGSEFT